MRFNVYLVLVNIRSAHNVGSIFRTADAAGVSKIYLVGYTPLPVDRFGRTQKEIAKTALGAEKSVPWEHSKSFARLAEELKGKKICLVALEQTPRSKDYKKFKPAVDFALAVGSEVKGFSPKDLGLCDDIIEIPMRGKKESLNVSVALGIALFRLAGV
jgi:23S rRNA (guanosine2251-2'-O)-methyltransferase